MTPANRLRSLVKEATEFSPGYFVTRDGRVFSSLSNWRGYGIRELTQQPDADGYMRVRCVLPDGKRKSLRVHKLVATAYLPAPLPSHETRHLNGDRADNRWENLAWGTQADNAADRDRHGRTYRGSRNGFSKLTETQVYEIRTRLAEGATAKGLADVFGVDPKTIRLIKNGETWAHL